MADELENMEEVILPIIALEAGFNGAVINITKDLNLYVRTDGNDINDGYYDTAQHAFRTGSRAYQEAMKYCLGVDAQVIINLGYGVFNSVICQGSVSGSYQENDGGWKAAVVVRGKGSANTTVMGSAAAPSGAAVLAGQGSRITVENLTVGTGGFGNGLVAADSGVLNLGAGLAFGSTGRQIMAIEGGLIKRFSNYSIIAGGLSHLYTFVGGVIEGSNTTTIAPPVTYSDAFAVADAKGFIYDMNSLFTGTVTGMRFRVEPTGAIFTGNSGLNYFPGTIPGTIAPGGSYDSAGLPISAAPKAMSVQLPVLNDEVSLFFNKTAITISQINSVVRGTSPSATWSLFQAATRNGAPTTVVAGVVTNVQTNLSTVSFANPAIPADRWVWLKVTATTGTVLELGVSLNF